jgi:PTS system galactitol-specific IIA component
MLPGAEFKTPQEAISALGALAEKENFVNSTFLPAVLTREAAYPTGLAMPAISLAIPHISDGCLQPFVSIATLKEPVVFKSMDLSGDDVAARIVFLFGIIEPKNQLAVLRQFAKSFADEDAVMKLLAAQTPKGLLEALSSVLEGLLEIQK